MPRFETDPYRGSRDRPIAVDLAAALSALSGDQREKLLLATLDIDEPVVLAQLIGLAPRDARTRIEARIGWIGIPQRSSLLPYRAVLPLGWKHGRARQASPRFRTIQDLPKDLSAALRQAEGEEDRPQGFRRLPAVPRGGHPLKAGGEEVPMVNMRRRELIGGAASPGHHGQPTANGPEVRYE